jgi:hypothetical protein
MPGDRRQATKSRVVDLFTRGSGPVLTSLTRRADTVHRLKAEAHRAITLSARHPLVFHHNRHLQHRPPKILPTQSPRRFGRTDSFVTSRALTLLVCSSECVHASSEIRLIHITYWNEDGCSVPTSFLYTISVVSTCPILLFQTHLPLVHTS